AAKSASACRTRRSIEEAVSFMRGRIGGDRRSAVRAKKKPAPLAGREFRPAAVRGTAATGDRETTPPASRQRSSEFGLHLLDDGAEGGRITHREIGQHLAVDVDRRAAHAGHEPAVGDAELAGRGIDAGDPELAEDALAGAA